MGRPKKAIPQYVEPEEISQEEDSEEEAVTEFNRDHEAPTGETVSKAEAVRLALAAGMEKPQEGVEWIRKHYGIEMERPTWSSYRAQQKARDEKKAAASAPAPRQQATPAAPRQTAPTPAPKAAAPAAPSSGIIGDIADIKRLLATHGKDGLEELIDVLG